MIFGSNSLTFFRASGSLISHPYPNNIPCFSGTEAPHLHLREHPTERGITEQSPLSTEEIRSPRAYPLFGSATEERRREERGLVKAIKGGVFSSSDHLFWGGSPTGNRGGREYFGSFWEWLPKRKKKKRKWSRGRWSRRAKSGRTQSWWRPSTSLLLSPTTPWKADLLSRAGCSPNKETRVLYFILYSWGCMNLLFLMDIFFWIIFNFCDFKYDVRTTVLHDH